MLKSSFLQSDTHQKQQHNQAKNKHNLPKIQSCAWRKNSLVCGRYNNITASNVSVIFICIDFNLKVQNCRTWQIKGSKPSFTSEMVIKQHTHLFSLLWSADLHRNPPTTRRRCRDRQEVRPSSRVYIYERIMFGPLLPAAFDLTLSPYVIGSWVMSRLSFDILIAWMDRDKVKGQAVFFFLTTKLCFFSFLLIFINTHLIFSGECFLLEHHRWTRTNMVFIFSPQFSELSIYAHTHTHNIKLAIKGADRYRKAVTQTQN